VSKKGARLEKKIDIQSLDQPNDLEPLDRNCEAMAIAKHSNIHWFFVSSPRLILYRIGPKV